MRYRSLSYTAKQLADIAKGRLLGATDTLTSDLCSLDYPKADSVTFIKSESAEHVIKQLSLLPTPVVVLVPEKLTPTHIPPGVTLILVPDAYDAFLNLVPLFYEEPALKAGIHETAIIDPTAEVDNTASIGAYCVVGPRSKIGKNVTLLAHVRIYEDVTIHEEVRIYSGTSIRANTVIGARTIIHDNVVIGADGFGYTPDPAVGLRKVLQVGNVVIGSDVEIGAGTCIDRGAFGPTTIGRGAKIDNLVQIGHNTSIGDFTIVCGQAAIAGSCKIGGRVIVGGGVGIADHLEIVSGVRLGGRAGVTTSLREPGDYLGFPAVRANDWRRMQVQLRRLIRGGRQTKTSE
jgi:UDP-3-O-[3-hydroxymyristoyl] glucosamine N-acyltransferase